jgi:hypothetical protein
MRHGGQGSKACFSEQSIYTGIQILKTEVYDAPI